MVYKMLREVNCSLKFLNKNKIQCLDKLFGDYKEDLIYYINLFKTKQLLLDRNLSSKMLFINKIKHSQYRQIIYKDALEIIKSNLKYIKNKVYNKYKKIYKKCLEKNKYKWFTNKRFSELNINYLKRININIKNISIDIDNRLLDYSNDAKFFDEIIGFRLPYFYTKKIKEFAIKINLPI